MRVVALSVALAAGAWVASAQGAAVGGYEPRLITTIFTYSTFGGGDVIFQVNAPVAGCDGGFWLKPTDPGFKSLYATVLLAYAAKSTIRVWAYDDQIWSGSGSKFCRIDAISPA